jgi:hypothetical protein
LPEIGHISGGARELLKDYFGGKNVFYILRKSPKENKA